jgi:hypothetical protein
MKAEEFARKYKGARIVKVHILKGRGMDASEAQFQIDTTKGSFVC